MNKAYDVYNLEEENLDDILEDIANEYDEPIPFIRDCYECLIDREGFLDYIKRSDDGLFVANGTASTSNLATKLGVLLNNNFIKVDSNFETNVKGCFAIGDSIGGLLQISKCVSDGAICATYINKLLKEKE